MRILKLLLYEIAYIIAGRDLEEDRRASYELGHRTGSNTMLDRIRFSLAMYPNHGGDIEVMKQVTRIVKEAVESISVPISIRKEGR